jgi:hypothetical protein
MICPLECMPRLLIENVFLKSRMNREVHVRFREELGVKIPLLTRLYAILLTTETSQNANYFLCSCIQNHLSI